MAGLIDSEEAAILDYIIATRIVAPYLGLSTTTPTDAGANFTEPVGNNYARLSVPNAQWAAAVGGSPSTKANTNLFTMPTATGSWGLITFAGIFDGAAGALKMFGALLVSKSVASGDTAAFAPGTIILQLGDPADTY